MIKAEDIRKINPREYKYLTKDQNGGVYAWNSEPVKTEDDWMFGKPGSRGYFLGDDIEVEEFVGKNWKDCLIEFEPDYNDMIGCVGWFGDSEDVGVLGVLTGFNKGEIYRFCKDNGGKWVNFRPAKPDELKFHNK